MVFPFNNATAIRINSNSTDVFAIYLDNRVGKLGRFNTTDNGLNWIFGEQLAATVPNAINVNILGNIYLTEEYTTITNGKICINRF